jgi:predicted amidophosphoribosyltransferase
MIPSITFTSCYVYAPGGRCDVSERSRSLCALLKAGDARLIQKYARCVTQHARECPTLAGFFRSSDVLVPVPGSEPVEPLRGSVARLLAEALVREGLAGAQCDCIRRVWPVRKSATAAPRDRPSVEFTRVCGDAARLTLVDDVVTRGRTLLAAATRLHDVFPRARIQAFALLRTMGFASRVDRLLEPCIGEIAWRRGDARRNP